MRKGISIFIITLLACPVFAQITSGTIIILNFTKDQLVVAADSRGVNTDTGLPHDSECKIAEFGHRLVFTSVGNARRSRVSNLDPIGGWDNTQMAETAFRSLQPLPVEDFKLRRIAANWADAIVAYWRSLYNWSPDRVTRLAARDGGLTAGVFAEANKGTIYFRAARIQFDKTRASQGDPITPELIERLSDCWECGQGSKICALGKHFDIAARFCSEGKSNARIRVRTPLRKANKAVKLAVKITELTIDAYNKTPGDVGGIVDAITLKNDGTITWNAMQDRCQTGRN